MASPSSSLLHKFLDNAFDAKEDVGSCKVSARHAKRDLAHAGLKGLLASELRHVEQLIASASSECVLSYDELIQALMENDFSAQHLEKISIDEKLMQRQRNKEQQSRELAKAVHPNHSVLTEVERKLTDEANKHLNKGPNELHLDPIMYTGDDDFYLCFLLTSKLRRVLDQKRFRLVDAFQEMDVKGHGKVTKFEFGMGLARLGVPVSGRQLERIFDLFDLDNSGTVEFREFSRIVQATTLTRHKEKLERRSKIEHNVSPRIGKPLKQQHYQGEDEEKTKIDPADVLEEHDENYDGSGDCGDSDSLGNGEAQVGDDDDDDDDGDDVIVKQAAAGNKRASKTSKRYSCVNAKTIDNHTCFQVSDRKYYLCNRDIMSQADSVLGQVVAKHGNSSSLPIFLDLNPDIFEVVVSRYFSGNADSKTAASQRALELVAKPGVNIHTVNRMCNILGLPPKLLVSERIALERAGGDNNKETKEPYGDDNDGEEDDQRCKEHCSKCNKTTRTRASRSHHHHSTCSHHHKRSTSHMDDVYKVQVEKDISSNSQGLEVHVRENETLCLETVSGSGQLVMDIFKGDDMELSKEISSTDIVCFDSRAFFHMTNLEPVNINKRLPGSAHYRFKVRSVPSNNDVRRSFMETQTTLSVTFSIVPSYYHH